MPFWGLNAISLSYSWQSMLRSGKLIHFTLDSILQNIFSGIVQNIRLLTWRPNVEIWLWLCWKIFVIFWPTGKIMDLQSQVQWSESSCCWHMLDFLKIIKLSKNLRNCHILSLILCLKFICNCSLFCYHFAFLKVM